MTVLATAIALAFLAAGEAGTGQASRSDAKTDEELLACARTAPDCGMGPWDVARELARRRNLEWLTRRYHSGPELDRNVLVMALWSIDDDSAVPLMRSVAREETDEARYLALDFLAKRCDAGALAELSHSAPLAPCLDWAATVQLFGRCRYEGAAAFLVEMRRRHACLNVVFAATESLQATFPDGPPLAAATEHYYRERSEVPCYENVDYGFRFIGPRGWWMLLGEPPRPNHGARLILGSSEIRVWAAYNAAGRSLSSLAAPARGRAEAPRKANLGELHALETSFRDGRAACQRVVALREPERVGGTDIEYGVEACAAKKEDADSTFRAFEAVARSFETFEIAR